MTLMSAGIINAQEGPTVIDNFEDGDMTEYSRADGQTSTTRSYNGSISYSAPQDDTQLTWSNPGDGLPAYFSPGNELNFWVYLGSSACDWRFIWGFDNGFAYNDGQSYQFNFRPLNGRTELTKGGTRVAEDTSYSPPGDQWLRGRVFWDTNGDILCEVYDTSGTPQSSLFITDTDYTAGGIGFVGRADTANDYHIDYITAGGL